MPLVDLEIRYKSRCPQEGLQNFLVDAEKHSLLCATYGVCKDTLSWSGIVQVSNFGWTSNFESNLGWTSFNFDLLISVMWGERYFCTTTSWSDSGLSLLFAPVWLLTNFAFTFEWLPVMWMLSFPVHWAGISTKPLVGKWNKWRTPTLSASSLTVSP